MNMTTLNTVLQGLPISLFMTFIALFCAFLLATLFTTILYLKTPILKRAVIIFVTLFTGTPLLIQIFIIYYGPGQFPEIQQHAPLFWALFSSPVFCAILAFALNSSAYSTQLFYGALKAIPSSQWEASRALGLSHFQTFCILFPYAFKRALSAYSNEVVLIFKATSLASTITIMDIMGYAKQVYGTTYDFSVYVLAGVIYLVINAILTLLLRFIEKRALRFENTQ